MARAKVGQQAPDFELPGTDGPFRLSAHRGRRVVLLFYPGDNTPVCTRQFCSYRDRAEDVDGLDAVIVGISNQDLDSHEQFKLAHGLNVPLLADVDGSVAKAYGAHARAAQSAACWVTAAAAFVLFLVLAEFDDRVLQVEIAFIGAAALLACSLYALYRRA